MQTETQKDTQGAASLNNLSPGRPAKSQTSGSESVSGRPLSAFPPPGLCQESLSCSGVRGRAPKVAEGRKLWSPGGQIVLPVSGIRAQLGFDGLSYEVEPPKRPENEPVQGPGGAAETPILGTLREVSQVPLIAGEFRQVKGVRQRTLWSMMEPSFESPKGELPGRCCKVRRTKEAVELVRSESGAWSFRNLITCNSAHACPVCAEKRARKACAEIGACIGRHLTQSVYHDVWMLTLTMPHTAEMPMAETKGKLVGAWERMNKSHGWQELKKKWGIRGVLRTFDSTFGSNGWHPHWHVALIVDKAHWFVETKSPFDFPSQPMRGFLRAEQVEMRNDIAMTEVTPLWEAALDAENAITGNRDAVRAHSVRITGAEKAAEYFVKWGLAAELALPGIKGSNTQWNLLDAVGDAAKSKKERAWAKGQFMEFFRATKGLPIITGLKRLRKVLNVSDDDVEAHVARLKLAREKVLVKEGKTLPKVAPLALTIESGNLFKRAIAVGWHEVFTHVDAAAARGEDPQVALTWYLATAGRSNE